MSVPVKFVDPREVAVADLKNGYLNNILSGEGLMVENAIVTNRRIYYNKKSGVLVRIEERDKIDVMDVTGIKIARANSYVFMAIGAAIALILLILSVESALKLMGLGLLILGIVIDLIVTKNYLSIEYAGGHIRFSVKKYSMENISQFQEAVFRVKDSLKANAR